MADPAHTPPRPVTWERLAEIVEAAKVPSYTDYVVYIGANDLIRLLREEAKRGE